MANESITERLAIGLARQAIRDWKVEVERSQRRLDIVFARSLSTGKAARRLARDIEAIVRPVAFDVSSLQIKKQGTFQHWVVPSIFRTDHGDYLQVEALSSLIGLNGHEILSGKVALVVHSHALARLFLRLQSVDRADVQREIGSTVLAATTVAKACVTLGLQQVVFPTASGVFRCDLMRLDEETVALAAKTWISNQTAGARDQAVSTTIMQAMMAWMKTVEPPTMVPYLLMSAEEPEELVNTLGLALAAHDWLKEPYVERPDHLSQMWTAARQQAAIE